MVFKGWVGPLPGATQFSGLSPLYTGGVKSESVSHSVLSLSEHVYYSQQGSSVHGILQARILEWVAISFSRLSSPPRVEPGSPAVQADSLPSESPE